MIALAWRNLWRQPRRTIITLLAIAFASMVMVFLLALQVGTYGSMKQNTMRLFDGFAQVQKPGYQNNPDIHKSFANLEATVRLIKASPGIETVAPRAQTYALLSNKSRSVAAMVAGVHSAAEKQLSRIASTIKYGRYLEKNSKAEIVLGQALARNLGVNVGQQVTLLGTARDGSVAADVLEVVGIFDSGLSELDHQLAEIPLLRFQTDFNMPKQANVLAISGDSLQAVNRAIPALRQHLSTLGLRLLDWGELEPGLSQAIELDASISMLWYVALIVVVIAILLNTLLMSVLERTREFGILLALGMRPVTAGRMVWLEFIILLFLGLVTGTSLGAAIAAWYSYYGLALPGAEDVFAQWGLPGLMYPRLTLFSLLTGPLAIAAIGALAGLFPFIRLHQLDPIKAMGAV